jgi:hypothetical protein
MSQFGVRKKVLFSINISISFNALVDTGMPLALTQSERLTWVHPLQTGCRRSGVAVAPHYREICHMTFRYGI